MATGAAAGAEHQPVGNAAEPLQRVWISVRGSLRAVLEGVSIADIAADQLPPIVAEYTADPRAWQRQEKEMV